MPDPYTNPSYKPPTGRYQWVPTGPPSGGEVPGTGFLPLTLDRGEFRNDTPKMDANPNGGLEITFKGTLLSDAGTENGPVLAAFRRIARPSVNLGHGGTFHVKDADFEWQAKVVQDPDRISAITLEYALTVDGQHLDDALRNALEPDDLDKLNQYQPGGEPPDIDWTKYDFVGVEAKDGNGNASKTYLRGDTPTEREIHVTGIESATNETATLTLKFGTSAVPEDYAFLKTIRLYNKIASQALIFRLVRIWIFNAQRVNFGHQTQQVNGQSKRVNQLPCALMEYAYPVSFKYNPVSRGSTWPISGGARPTFHTKMFLPEDQSGTTGLAHSVYLKFLIASFPAVGISPADYSSLVGLLTDIAFPMAYYVVFVGPLPGRKTVRYALYAKPLKDAGGRVVLLDKNSIDKSAVSVTLEKAAGYTGTTPPPDSVAWKALEDSEYVISTPPTFNASGPYVSEFLYLDKAGKDNEWYRTIQRGTSGGDVVGQSMRGEAYSERTILRLSDSAQAGASSFTQTVTRRPVLNDDEDPLKLDPVAVFMSDDDSPFAAAEMARGPWKLKFRAKSDDEESLLATQLFVRFWLQSENQPVDLSNPHKYRSSTTELIFKDDGLAFGTPSSMDQLMVSPPLPSSLTLLELIRYNDREFSINAPADGRNKLVMGVYAIASRNAAGREAGLDKNSVALPKYSVEFDVSTASLETTINQSISHSLFPERYYDYASSSYSSIAKPLKLTRNLVGSGTIGDDPASWVSYDEKMSVSTQQNPTVDAFKGLITLRDGSSADPLVYIPITTVPNKSGDGEPVYADVVTDVNPLSGGRVTNGQWRIRLTTMRGPDTPEVAIDYRFEVFLAGSDGKIQERVFRSPVIDGLKASGGSDDVVFEVPVTYGYLIGGSGTQVVVRVHAIPYARNGGTLDVPTIRRITQEAGLPFGARVLSLSLEEHTVQELVVNQSSSFLNSPAFYENLPLVPTQTLGHNEHWYISSAENLKALVIVVRGYEWPIEGCLYAPAWYINMPADMEVITRAPALNTTQFSRLLWVRTVPADQRGAEASTTAAESDISGSIHVAVDDSGDAGASSLAVDGTVRLYTFNNPFRPPTANSIAHGGNGQAAPGVSPAIQFVNHVGSPKSQPLLALITETTDSDFATFQVGLNAHQGGDLAWIGPNRDLGDNAYGDVRMAAEGMSKPVLACSPTSTTSYLVGWVQPGTVIAKELNLFDAGRGGGRANGEHYVVDGAEDYILGAAQGAVLPSGGVSGLRAIETFSGAMIDDQSRLTVSYSLDGQHGILYGRTTSLMQAFGKRFPIVNLRAMGASASEELVISGSALTWHRSTATGYVAFYCGGKIFVTTVQPYMDSGVMLAPLQLVAGSENFDSAQNKANGAFKSIKALYNLRVNREGGDENDVGAQRPGLVVSEKWPNQGHLIVYYRDADNDLKMRRVHIGGSVTAPQLIS